MHLQPLKQWFCDMCGEVIQAPGDGWLEWLEDEDNKNHGFKIVHHAPASPRAAGGCYHYGNAVGRSDMHLDKFLEADGLVWLLAMIDPGAVVTPEYGGPEVRDLREWAEIVRRLHVPYYEEARKLWPEAKRAGYFEAANELWPYIVSTSKSIIDKFGNADEDS